MKKTIESNREIVFYLRSGLAINYSCPKCGKLAVVYWIKEHFSIVHNLEFWIPSEFIGNCKCGVLLKCNLGDVVKDSGFDYEYVYGFEEPRAEDVPECIRKIPPKGYVIGGSYYYY